MRAHAPASRASRGRGKRLEQRGPAVAQASRVRPGGCELLQQLSPSRQVPGRQQARRRPVPVRGGARGAVGGQLGVERVAGHSGAVGQSPSVPVQARELERHRPEDRVRQLALAAARSPGQLAQEQLSSLSSSPRLLLGPERLLASTTA